MKRILLCTMMPLIIFCSTQNLTGTSDIAVQQKESVSFESSEFFITDSNDDSVLPIDPVALNFSVQSNNTEEQTINASTIIEAPSNKVESVTPQKAETVTKPVAPESPVVNNDKVNTPSVNSDVKYYNVPLTNEQQLYAMDVCKKYGVDVRLIFAMMSVESTYNPNSVNGNCYGILQINKVHLKNFKKTLGVTEIKSYQNNVLCGVYMISGYINKYNDIHKALICYNCGSGNASKLFEKEIFQTSYSKKVVKRMEAIKFK